MATENNKGDNSTPTRDNKGENSTCTRDNKGENSTLTRKNKSKNSTTLRTANRHLYQVCVEGRRELGCSLSRKTMRVQGTTKATTAYQQGTTRREQHIYKDTKGRTAQGTLFLARSCLGQVPDGALFSQRSELVTGRTAQGTTKATTAHQQGTTKARTAHSQGDNKGRTAQRREQHTNKEPHQR